MCNKITFSFLLSTSSSILLFVDWKARCRDHLNFRGQFRTDQVEKSSEKQALFFYSFFKIMNNAYENNSILFCFNLKTPAISQMIKIAMTDKKPKFKINWVKTSFSRRRISTFIFWSTTRVSRACWVCLYLPTLFFQQT